MLPAAPGVRTTSSDTETIDPTRIGVVPTGETSTRNRFVVGSASGAIRKTVPGTSVLPDATVTFVPIAKFVRSS